MSPKPLKVAEIVLLLVVVGAGVWFAMKKPPVSPPMFQQADTSTWTTYANPSYPVTLKYPKDYQDIDKDFKIQIIPHALNGTVYEGTTIDHETVPVTYSASQHAWLDQQGKPDSPASPMIDTTSVSGATAWYAWRLGDYDVCNEFTTVFVESPNKDFVLKLEGHSPTWVCELGFPPAGGSLLHILSTVQFGGMMDTSIWKTYQNTKYGFEFKYPSTVKLGPEGMHWVIKNLYDKPGMFISLSLPKKSGDDILSVAVNPGPIEGCMEPDQDESDTKEIAGIIAGHDLCIYKDYFMEGYGFEHDGNFFLISASYAPENREMIQQILSTFRFTK